MSTKTAAKLTVVIGEPLFETGRATMTTNWLNTVCDGDRIMGTMVAMNLVERHVAGDWKDLEPADRQMNKLAVGRDKEFKNRVFSVYDVCGHKTYVITDPGWETTTVLLPSDY